MSSPPLIIHALPGSQFVFKVLAALQSRKIDHYVNFVPLTSGDRKKYFKSDNILVPQLQIGNGDSKEMITDSERILQWFDDHQTTSFFPTPEASELSKRASDKTLAAMVWYYNWVDQEGYTRSMRHLIGKKFPGFVPWFVVDLILGSTRAKFRSQVKTALDLDDAALDDSAAMHQKLVDELKYFQTFLKDDSQTSLLQGQDQPTAADVSVYAQLERLVGGEGASDCPIPQALPSLKEEPGLDRLWKWHENIRTQFPVQFKGKRPNKEWV